MWREAVVAYIKVSFQHSSGRTEKDHGKPQKEC
jgi:hypothetical protein